MLVTKSGLVIIESTWYFTVLIYTHLMERERSKQSALMESWVASEFDMHFCNSAAGSAKETISLPPYQHTKEKWEPI